MFSYRKDFFLNRLSRDTPKNAENEEDDGEDIASGGEPVNILETFI
jgi:hypothetical protein